MANVAARGRRSAPHGCGSRRTSLHGASPGREGRWSIWLGAEVKEHAISILGTIRYQPRAQATSEPWFRWSECRLERWFRHAG
jgi:hypothetical protein